MIPHALSGLTFIERFYTYPTLASTNEVARKIVQRPRNGLFCIQADRQTEGKGRRGDSFFSAFSVFSGIYRFGYAGDGRSGFEGDADKLTRFGAALMEQYPHLRVCRQVFFGFYSLLSF